MLAAYRHEEGRTVRAFSGSGVLQITAIHTFQSQAPSVHDTCQGGILVFFGSRFMIFRVPNAITNLRATIDPPGYSIRCFRGMLRPSDGSLGNCRYLNSTFDSFFLLTPSFYLLLFIPEKAQYKPAFVYQPVVNHRSK
jgi:hypothetical protein